ncbi:MAG TPA: phosphatidate cytidylyltransferase [Longimicrobiales bacterium]
MASELTKRVAVAAIGIPLAVLVVYIGGWLLAVILAAIAAGGAVELYRLARKHGVRPLTLPGAALAAALVPLPLLVARPEGVAFPVFVAASLAIAAAAIFLRGVAGSPLAVTAITAFGALLTGGTLMYAVMLRRLPVTGTNIEWSDWVGPALVAFPITLTWLGDTFAYFGGRRFGRRKLIPAVSPGKTVEGALSSVLGTVLVGAGYAHFVFGMWLGVPLDAVAGALIGLVISPVAQVGDLAESLLKREAGVKDSGALLPGHGGVLDRFDALFFTIPVMYWLLLVALPGVGAR